MTIDVTGMSYFELESAGFCEHCGTMTEGACEPDAVGYICPACGEGPMHGIMYALDHDLLTGKPAFDMAM